MLIQYRRLSAREVGERLFMKWYIQFWTKTFPETPSHWQTTEKYGVVMELGREPSNKADLIGPFASEEVAIAEAKRRGIQPGLTGLRCYSGLP